MKHILHALSLSALVLASSAMAQSRASSNTVYVYTDASGAKTATRIPPQETNTQEKECLIDRYLISGNGYLNYVSKGCLGEYTPPAPVTRPKPIAQKEEKKKEEKKKEEAPVDGTISREQRCKDAQSDIATIQERQTIYEEDKNGNLVPLSPEQAQARLEQAQAIAAKVCQ